MDICSPKTITQVLSQHKLSPLKKLGQNFLCDENIVNKIADSAVQTDCVLEIGPGLGALTAALAKRAKRVISIEIDSGMIRALETTLADFDNIEIIHEDILKADLNTIADKFGEPFSVAGNLPYYITSKCIMQVLECGLPIVAFTAMVQKEVADRLSAAPGNADYGALTASVAYFGCVQKIINVSRGCFYPKPDVDSAVIQISPKPQFDIEREFYSKTVRALFSMRRKTLLNNMTSALSLPKTRAEEILASLNIRTNERAENLTPEQFSEIAKKIYKY